MNLLGIDIGSSTIKVAVLDSISGRTIASAGCPETEMTIESPQPGWAEQNPNMWWRHLITAMQRLSLQMDISTIGAIGIAYQMHGLVCVDKHKQVLRPVIMWCDSRAVELGQRAFKEIGREACLKHLLNSPGNFTLSKLAWVKKYEPKIFNKIHKIMLPGDFIAMRMTGEVNTTVSGLSEGIMWDFADNSSAGFLLDYFNIPEILLPETVPSFGIQGVLSRKAADAMGISRGIPVCYRAGDQPNNAFSLKALNPGEVAATAGTSGVVYVVSDEKRYDPKSRVNIFAHVNHQKSTPRYGILLCINGAGSLNHWIRSNVAAGLNSYSKMNFIASKAPIGAEGLIILPFGNGAERVIENKNPGALFANLDFNVHTSSHIYRAAQEGIAFAFKYGMDLMEKFSGIELKTIRAGRDNMFLSPIFRDTLASITRRPIELYATDGATGAARGAGLGVGMYRSVREAFESLNHIDTVDPDMTNHPRYQAAYDRWHHILQKI